jgi:predicted DNA-binding antitoxin AbrB/MazE fold protein
VIEVSPSQVMLEPLNIKEGKEKKWKRVKVYKCVSSPLNTIHKQTKKKEREREREDCRRREQKREVSK